ncbi:MAG: UDP-N-acetylmuramoyl-L-alanine--D-glutamate ligase [Ignavibacteriae bacterium]|nr:UDP-N-acetylmuramoyl-L-alanine--D-glutamate ligase [Ignavibacteriota bacterium]
MYYTIIGAARSGLAAALLAKSAGHYVFVSELKPESECKESVEQLKHSGIDFEFGGNTEKALTNADCVITSPGVPRKAWVIEEADKRGIPVISELEFARQFCPNNPLIAITGTNGKTTVTTLTAYILNQAGKKALAVGNIGTPLSAVVRDLDLDTILVVEVSSYQLDRIREFRPDVGIILNISPDHLAYHGTFEDYAQTKWKTFSNMTEKDFVILNADDAATLANRTQTKGENAYFSMSPVQYGVYAKEGKLVMRFPEHNKEEVIMQLDEIRLPGVHNVYNSMAAALAARCFEVRNENIRDSLMSFEGVEHRLEFVRTLEGVDYVNDSKATNVNATWYALSSYNKPLIWIAGGRGDNNDYSSLDELVKKNVKCVVAIGEEADAIFNHYSSMVRCIKADSLESAVYSSRDYAEAGNIVLFTPACKSFDMFMNFEHRGEVFKQIVYSL